MGILQVAGFDERLRAHAWNFLDTCPLRLFNDPGCLLLNERDLAEFLSRNTLLCDEIEIFKCVRRWSQGRASSSARKNAGKDRCTRARPLPQSLLDAIPHVGLVLGAAGGGQWGCASRGEAEETPREC